MGGFSALADLGEAALLLHLVELVLAVSLIELLWLLGRRPTGFANLAPNLLAGLSLTLALRLCLGGAGIAWIAACLASAGVWHALDMLARHRPDIFNIAPTTGHRRQAP